jgi:hypothetical protein
VEAEYPWGKKTATYQAWLILFAINVIAVSILFLAYIEIPFIQGEDVFAGFNFELDQKAHAQLTTGGGTDLKTPGEVGEGGITTQQKLLIYCFAIIGANMILVWVTKKVGEWVSKLEKQCKKKKCKWWCLCCNKWHCVLVWVLKWVTWLISIISTVITTALIWVCFQGTNPLGG